MIVKDINTVKTYIGVNAAFQYEDILPYLQRAERKYLKEMIGPDQMAIFDTGSAVVEVQNAILFAEEAVSNLAYYLGLPVLTLQISSGGIFETVNENTTAATDKQFKELQRSFKTAGHEAIDVLLSYMEENKTFFAAWSTSEYYTEYKQTLVFNTSTFQKYYNINNSRQTFRALLPNIITVEDQFIVGPVGNDLFEALKEDQTEALRIQVKELLIKSIIAFTIYKTVDNGMFVIGPNGIYLKFDVLPYEKAFSNINLKINDFLINTKKNKLNEGEEYLKQAFNIFSNIDNATIFPEYVTPEAITQKAGIIKTPGIVGI